MRYVELVEILLSDKPSIKLREKKEDIALLIPEIKKSFNFDQKNIWHPYDVFEHTLRVVDEVDNSLVLRLAALFHDIGKPYKMKLDDDGQGHFYGHWDKSKEIFIQYKNNFYIGYESFTLICNLIEYHDLNIDMRNVRKILKEFSEDEFKQLLSLKRADILAQNKDFIGERLEDLERQRQLYYSALKSYGYEKRKDVTNG